MTTIAPGPVWTPDPDQAQRSAVRRFARFAEHRNGVTVPDYAALWAWSIADLSAFWATAWDFFDIPASRGFDSVLTRETMPGAHWFDEARLNYADQVLQHAARPGPAIVAVDEHGERSETGWAQLRDQVAALAGTLRAAGVRPGDRVVGYLPTIPAAVVGLLATAAVGATWSVCGQDYGARAAADRLAQLEPSVLLAADGYRFGGREHDRRDAVVELAAALPSLRAVIRVDHLGLGWEGRPSAVAVLDRAAATAGAADPVTEQVPPDHPLWVLFSSGTTGRPKGIVHGHAGVLLGHLVGTGLQLDVGEGDRLFMHTSTNWMVWNVLVSGLLLGATIVLYDGSPTHPDHDRLWQLVADEHVTLFVTSPGHLQASERAGLRPGTEHDLSALRQIGSSGSPLPPAAHIWAADAVSPQIPLVSSSGGTDVVGAFVGGAPDLPVHPGEISAPALGVAVEVFDPAGHSVRDEAGELVVTRPMPSMPLYFWNDPDGSRYREAYFDTYPGVWRHGDRATITERGTVLVHGRSDSTLNRHGVRLGSAEIYAVVERFPEVREALVVGVEQPDGGYWMPLFVALADGARLDDDLRTGLARALRRDASPRHVPDEVIEVPGIPHTRTGKKLEVPVKRLLQGAAPDDVLSLDAVDAPDLIAHFVGIATARRPRGEAS